MINNKWKWIVYLILWFYYLLIEIKNNENFSVRVHQFSSIYFILSILVLILINKKKKPAKRIVRSGILKRNIEKIFICVCIAFTLMFMKLELWINEWDFYWHHLIDFTSCWSNVCTWKCWLLFKKSSLVNDFYSIFAQ